MAIDAVERSQAAVAKAEALSSPRVDTLAPTSSGEMRGTYGLKMMCGLWPEAGVAALRINSDILIWPEVMGNVRRDRLPGADGRWNGMLILYSTETRALLQRVTASGKSSARAGRLSRAGGRRVGHCRHGHQLHGAGAQA